MNKLTKKEEMYREIEAHGAKLNEIFGTEYGNIQLCKKLRRLEAKAHTMSEKSCNGTLDEGEEDVMTDKILSAADKILSFRAKGIPVFVNLDARGYALKIEDDWMRAKGCKLFSDWGGYGIIAPDFRVGGKW